MGEGRGEWGEGRGQDTFSPSHGGTKGTGGHGAGTGGHEKSCFKLSHACMHTCTGTQSHRLLPASTSGGRVVLTLIRML